MMCSQEKFGYAGLKKFEIQNNSYLAAPSIAELNWGVSSSLKETSYTAQKQSWLEERHKVFSIWSSPQALEGLR